MNTQEPRPGSPRGGFSAIEILLTVIVFAILMGVVRIRSSHLLERSHVSSIIQNAGEWKSACVLFHTDTAHYARFAAGSDSLTQSTLPGWNGPYLTRMNSAPWNPYGDWMLDNTHTGFGRVSGWDLDGDGSEETSGDCNVLVLTGIELDVASDLDRYYDSNKGQGWEKTGRFQYVPSEKCGMIFLLP